MAVECDTRCCCTPISMARSPSSALSVRASFSSSIINSASGMLRFCFAPEGWVCNKVGTSKKGRFVTFYNNVDRSTSDAGWGGWLGSKKIHNKNVAFHANEGCLHAAYMWPQARGVGGWSMAEKAWFRTKTKHARRAIMCASDVFVCVARRNMLFQEPLCSPIKAVR
jgi:hypothetical protein